MSNSKKIKKFGAKIFGDIGIRQKIIEPPSIDHNKPFVYLALFDKIEILNPTSGSFNDLPDSLVIPPNKYSFYGQTYELKKEGLYRFVFPGKENRQRIAYQKNIDALLSGICWIYSHGNSDDEKSYTQLTNKALHSKLFATCGPLSEWTNKFLKELNIKSRIVSTLTLDEWNNYDNGHVLLEVYRNDYGKWVVYDLDNKSYFTYQNTPLSLIEFAKHVVTNDYTIEYLAPNSDIDKSNYYDNKTKYNYTFVMEARFANEDTRRKWYKRVMQVPLIGDDKYNYFFNDNNIARVQSYSNYYKFMNKEEFFERFYKHT